MMTNLKWLIANGHIFIAQSHSTLTPFTKASFTHSHAKGYLTKARNRNSYQVVTLVVSQSSVFYTNIIYYFFSSLTHLFTFDCITIFKIGGKAPQCTPELEAIFPTS